MINWINSWHGRREIFLEDIQKIYDAKAVALLENLEEALKRAIA